MFNDNELVAERSLILTFLNMISLLCINRIKLLI